MTTLRTKLDKGCCSKCIIPLDYKPAQCNNGECECHQTEKKFDLPLDYGKSETNQKAHPSSEVEKKKSRLQYACLHADTGYVCSACVERLLAHQKQEIVEMVRGKKFEIKVGDYLPLVEDWDGKNFDVPFDHGYRTALTDILQAITKKEI